MIRDLRRRAMIGGANRAFNAQTGDRCRSAAAGACAIIA